MIDLARPWTAEELAVVRARYRIDGASVLATELGRTQSAVWRCANRQGVLKNRRWTAEEDERLRMRNLARELGYAWLWAAIATAAARLGITWGASEAS